MHGDRLRAEGIHHTGIQASLTGMLLALSGCGLGPQDGEAISSSAELLRVFNPPAGTLPVNFVVDDRANQVYGQGDLKWKGSFLYDEASRLALFDPFWSGAAPGSEPLSGWPTLYDDGPWTRGGHEPVGARARDHVWGIAMFVNAPAIGADSYEYGLIDASYERRLGNGWIWKGNNGSFVVAAGATDAVTAGGMILPRFGSTDLVLALDPAALRPDRAWDLSSVHVKASAWGWNELPLVARSDGTFLFRLSPHLGWHGLLPHTGLPPAGDVVEFVFTLGGVEYAGVVTDGTSSSWQAFTEGVSAATISRCGRRPVPASITMVPNGNTAITVPPSTCRAD